MAKKKNSYYKLGGYAAGAWGISQAVFGLGNLVRTSLGLRGFSLDAVAGADKVLVSGVIGADVLSYAFSIVFGVLLIVLGAKLVKN